MLPKQPDEAFVPSERRQSGRKRLIVNVDFEGGDTTGITNTRDIGTGGLFMVTGADFEIGTPLRLSITLAGREVSFDGTVAYTDSGQGIGVRFQNLSDINEKLLKEELHLE